MYSTVTNGAVGVFSTVSGVLVGQAVPIADFDLSILVIPLVLTFWTLAGATGFYYR